LTIAVILILGILWVAVLVPPIMRARGAQGNGNGISDFTHRLASVGRTLGHRDRRAAGATPRPLYVPTGPATAYGPSSTGAMGGGMSAQQKRRRDVLLVLGGAAGFTLLLALFTRSTMFIALFLLAAAALGGYVYLLLQYKQRAHERSTKVRYLGAQYGNSGPAYASPSYNGSFGGGYAASLADGAGESVSTRLVPLRQTAAR
jgi:hypothetical protein